MEWYESLGFRDNPLDSNPFKNEFEPLKLDDNVKELLYRVESGGMVLIVGDSGSGKSALLKEIIRNYHGKGKIIYFDASSMNRRLDVEKLLLGKNGFLRGTLLGEKPKGMILLLDNVQALSKRNSRLIKFYYDQDYIKSVVFTSDSKDVLDESFMSRIGRSVIELSTLSESDSVRLVQSRIGTELLDDKLIREIYAFSDENPKKLLLNCQIVLMSGLKSPSKAELKELLQEEPEPVEVTCESCGGELVELNEFVRCVSCDAYCKECGITLKKKSAECPNCRTIRVEAR